LFFEGGREMKTIIIYTDGACSGNPGPGGYGAVMLYGEARKELSGGFLKTTNNRMELLAVIKGLEALKEPCEVKLYSDSKYVVDAIEKGWAVKWRSQGWMRNKKEKASNEDLWERLLELLKIHRVSFIWVKGHADNLENERCDQLAREAIQKNTLENDEKYQTL
jgi:ribonuclease HI